MSFSIKNFVKLLHPRYQKLILEYPVDLKPRYPAGNAHRELFDIINANRESYQKGLENALSLKKQIWDIGNAQDEYAPQWNNGFLPGLDMVVLYSMLCEYKPAKYIEVGSGNSTKVAYKAKEDHQISMEIISIDPMPRAEIDRLADQVLRLPFENTEYKVEEHLEAGDVLFIDNSHRILPNSDAMVFFLETLPRLKPDVIVHIHDIYLPYDYPQFMCDRFYTEQYGLAMYLLANPQRFEVLMPNFFISEDQELAATIAPIWDHPNLDGVERHGGSFWLRIKG